MKKRIPSKPSEDPEPLEEPEIPEEEEDEEEYEPEIVIDGPPELKEFVELSLRAHKAAERLRKQDRLGQQDRRIQRRQMVAELISRDKTIRSQAEIQKLLEERGMLATQSSISRDLRDLGVQRVNGVYVLKTAREGGWSFGDVLDLVDLISRSGPYTTVIQTLPGAGRLVARSLDESGWDEVVGSVSDENTVFVAHRGKEGQNQFFERLRPYMKE